MATSDKNKLPNPNASRTKPLKYACPAITKAGNPCPMSRMVLTKNGKRYRSKYCLAHSSHKIQRLTGGGNRGPGAGHGRKKKQTASQILRDRFEAEADRYLAPLEEALVAMKAMVVGNGGSAHIEEYPDFALRLGALEKMLDRIYGRPKQAMELTGQDGSAVEISVPDDRERQLEVARVLAEVGAVNGVVIPANASASAPSTN